MKNKNQKSAEEKRAEQIEAAENDPIEMQLRVEKEARRIAEQELASDAAMEEEEISGMLEGADIQTLTLPKRGKKKKELTGDQEQVVYPPLPFIVGQKYMWKESEQVEVLKVGKTFVNIQFDDGSKGRCCGVSLQEVRV